MQPRLITHISDGTSSMTGKSMTLPESCSMRQVRIHSGRGAGARFMKKNSPPAPCGSRFITIARSQLSGSSPGPTSTQYWIRLPLVIFSAGQNSLSRFVRRTSLPATLRVASPDAGTTTRAAVTKTSHEAHEAHEVHEAHEEYQLSSCPSYLRALRV